MRAWTPPNFSMFLSSPCFKTSVNRAWKSRTIEEIVRLSSTTKHLPYKNIYWAHHNRSKNKHWAEISYGSNKFFWSESSSTLESKFMYRSLFTATTLNLSWSELEILSDIVLANLKHLKLHKSVGFNRIHPHLLKILMPIFSFNKTRTNRNNNVDSHEKLQARFHQQEADELNFYHVQHPV